MAKSPYSQQDHKDFLTSLTASQRIGLTKKSNHPAMIRLLVLSTSILLLVTLIIAQAPFWPLLMLPLGILLTFLFTLMHEATHDTAFASANLNRWVCYVCGFLLLLPPAWFRYFHLAHHRHTQDIDNDPELQSAKPTTVSHYLRHLTGASIWLSSCKTITGYALGQARESFVPVAALPAVRLETRLMLSGYIICTLLSVGLSSALLLKIWIVPILLGQPFLRFYLLAEHSGCPLTGNMFDNSRTTYTTRAVRFLCWNMPYHTEHHVYPTVPFHQLPTLHSLLKEQLRHTENGYYLFNRQYVETLR